MSQRIDAGQVAITIRGRSKGTREKNNTETMMTDLDFMDGYPHLSLKAETAQDEAWLTKFMDVIAKSDELTTYYWPILVADLVGHDPESMTLGMYKDYFTDDKHSHAVVNQITFRTICPEYDEHITPEILKDMAKLMQKTAIMLLE